MNAKQVWQTTIERLQARVKPEVFTIWFQGTSALSFQDGVLIIQVPTTFARSHLEIRFIDLIRATLTEVTGQSLEVRFVVGKDTSDHGSNEQVLAINKRPYRFAKSRPTATQREKRIAEAAAAAAQSALVPVEPPARDPQPRSITRRTMEPVPPTPQMPRTPTLPPTPQPRVRNQPPTRLEEEEPALQEEFREPDAEPEPVPEHTPYIARRQVQDVREYGEALAIQEKSGPTFGGQGLLNPRYTFSTFIVGKSNQLAHAASLAVSENVGRVYNPLFLYGGVGLGKTHLLHAVGHVGESNGLNVLYTTSEKFTNEIVNAIRYQKTDEFRTKYRQIDILLVDDIQFIAGKESTEEEFFHTFNALHNDNKQIVVTSDRPPKAIHSLQDRLRSRFEWGLLADVKPPEYEHRLGILRSKAESLHFAIPGQVLEYIARPECSSVRELEGALNRVIAYATLHDAEITVGLAGKALEHIYNDKKPINTSVTVIDILECVCNYFHVDISLVKGKQRERALVWPRQVAMYLMREETGASLLQIGNELGGRDHTTVLYGCERVQSEMKNNDRARQEVAAVLDLLQHR